MFLQPVAESCPAGGYVRVLRHQNFGRPGDLDITADDFAFGIPMFEVDELQRRIEEAGATVELK